MGFVYKDKYSRRRNEKQIIVLKAKIVIFSRKVKNKLGKHSTIDQSFVKPNLLCLHEWIFLSGFDRNKWIIGTICIHLSTKDRWRKWKSMMLRLIEGCQSRRHFRNLFICGRVFVSKSCLHICCVGARGCG